MTQLFDLKLRGTMTNTQPLHITPPNTETLSLTKDAKAVEIATLPIYRDGELLHLPVIPATTIRGKLRNASYEVIRQQLADKPSLAEWLYGTLGGIKGKESESPYSVQQRAARRAANPHLGLFGAAQPWDMSAMMISNAIPIHNVQPEFVGSARRDMLSQKTGLAELLDHDAIPTYISMRQASKEKVAASGESRVALAALAKAKSTGAGEAEALASFNQASEAAKTAKEEAGNSIGMPLLRRVMPIGVVMEQSITLKRVTAIESGLFIRALSYLFDAEPAFGGKVSNHYGCVDAEWTVSLREDKVWEPIGVIKATSFEPIGYESTKLDEFVAAWDAFQASGKLDMSTQLDKLPVASDDASGKKPGRKAKVSAPNDNADSTEQAA